MIEQLTRDNPQLLALETAYRASPHWDVLMKGSAWEAFSNGIDLQRFRAEAMYQTQLLFGATEQKYRNTFEYVRSIDTEGYLDGLGEDGAFGQITFEFDGVTVSRDLLDSILEIYFLRETMGPGINPTILDVGSGYGRFAYRLETVYPNAMVYCVDAVPISTFLCTFYLEYRNLAKPNRVIPLHQLNECRFQPIDLAMNVHSFSECTESAIDFWLGLVCDLGVSRLIVIPHDERFICVNADGSHPSFLPLIGRHGFELKIQKQKYPLGLENMVYPTVYCYYERR